MITNNLFDELMEWFDQYVVEFKEKKEDREPIDLKYKHSYRVYKNINKLANNIDLSNNEITLASIIGLFHDIGRFEQYKKYKTFSDSDSIDHGQLSVKILKDCGILEKISIEERNIVYQSIHNHNKIDIPKNISAKILLFSKLIRDADKLDIWSIFARRYHSRENNKKINLDLSDKPIITPMIYQKVLNGKAIKYSSLKTVEDFKLIQMGWAYDLNFKESLKILKERTYLSKIYHSMENSTEAKEVFDKIMTYIDVKTSSQS